jgi:hypothetical protein
MAQEKLTQQPEKINNFTDDDLTYLVSAGTSYKVKLIALLGWIASKAITFAEQITFTSAPKLSSVGSNKVLKTNANAEIIGVDFIADNYKIVLGNTTIVSGDSIIEAQNPLIISLSSAVGDKGRKLTFINTSNGVLTINTVGGQTIGNGNGLPSVTIFTGEVLEIVSNNQNWSII